MPDAAVKQRVTANVAARNALQREDGLTLLFDLLDYPTPDACRKAAMRFRMAFYTMRTKLRRQRQYDYDELMCLIEETSNGWQVSLTRESSLVSVVGEPIRELTPEHTRWLALINAATNCLGVRGAPNKPCPYTKDDVDFFWSYNPQRARAVYVDLGWPIPGEEPEPEPKEEPERLTTMEDLFPRREDTAPKGPTADSLGWEKVQREIGAVDTEDPEAVRTFVEGVVQSVGAKPERAKTFVQMAYQERLIPEAIRDHLREFYNQD